MKIKTTEDLKRGRLVKLISNPKQTYRVAEILTKFTVRLEYHQNGAWLRGGMMDVSNLKHAE